MFLLLSFGILGQNDQPMERTLPSFDKLKVLGGIAIELIPSEETKLVFQEKEEKYLQIEVEKDWLEIEKKTEEKNNIYFWDKWFKIADSKKITLTLYYKDLKHLILGKGVTLKSEKPIKNSNLILELETGTSFKSDFIAKNLAFELSTGSFAKIGGMIEKPK